MQWRIRRIVLGVLAAALVLAMTLLLGAVHDSFLSETDRAVGFFGADTWVVPEGISGPFTTNSPMNTAALVPLRRLPGAEGVAAVAIFRHVVRGAASGYTDVNVIAYPPGSIVRARTIAGREPRTADEVAADEQLHVPIGRVLTLAGRRLTVVGIVHGLTYNGGTPTVLVTLTPGQQIAFGGQPLASALIMRGEPEDVPDGLRMMTPTQVRDDLRRPLSVATGTIGVLSILLWVVAAGIVGFICYLSGLDRMRDLAVFKAIGVTTRRLVSGVVVEGLLVSVLAAAVAVTLALLFVPVFPLAVEVTVASCLQLLVVALVIGLLASGASVRQAVRVDPALAFSHS